MSVTVQEISMAARAGIAAMTGETAGYFVLTAADQLGDSAGKLGTIHLAEDGSVRVGSLGDGSPQDLEADLRSLLARVLSVSSSRRAALTRIGQASEHRGLERLAGELEAALIPVNRAAARRTLLLRCTCFRSSTTTAD